MILYFALFIRGSQWSLLSCVGLQRLNQYTQIFYPSFPSSPSFFFTLPCVTPRHPEGRRPGIGVKLGGVYKTTSGYQNKNAKCHPQNSATFKQCCSNFIILQATHLKPTVLVYRGEMLYIHYCTRLGQKKILWAINVVTLELHTYIYVCVYAKININQGTKTTSGCFGHSSCVLTHAVFVKMAVADESRVRTTRCRCWWLRRALVRRGALQ